MMAVLFDHLWQSIAFAAIVCCLVLLTRGNSAALRLWLWRIAALKFLLPFSLLFALGGWLGLPVRHSAVPPPAALSEMVSRGLSVAAPAQAIQARTLWEVAALLVALAVSAVCIAGILGRLRRERPRRDEEQARMEADWRCQPVPLNFLQSTLLASVAVLSVLLPVVAGATQDRLWRQQVLAIDQAALLSARIEMTELPEGLGRLSPVTANARGVLIRNINIQDLISLVYGITQFEVFGGAMPWLEYPRYDVRIFGPVRAPEVFDPYSLREPMTRYLYQRFGVSIRVNGSCQEPCVHHNSILVERLKYCPRPLSPHPCD